MDERAWCEWRGDAVAASYATELERLTARCERLRVVASFAQDTARGLFCAWDEMEMKRLLDQLEPGDLDPPAGED